MKHKEIILMDIVDRSISHFNMSDLITIISNSCFKFSSIESIKFSKNLKVIGDWAFYRCESLINMDFRNCPNLREIEYSAFCDCYELEKVHIPDKVKLGDGVFWGCHNLVKVRLPNDLKKIPRNFFMRCIKLISIDIPNSVVKIGDHALHGTGIKELNISKGIKFSEKGHESIRVNYID